MTLLALVLLLCAAHLLFMVQIFNSFFEFQGFTFINQFLHRCVGYFFIYLLIYLFIAANLTQARFMWEEGISIEKNVSVRLAYREVYVTLS